MSKNSTITPAPQRVEGVIIDYTSSNDPHDPNATLYQKIQIGNEVYTGISISDGCDKVKYASQKGVPVTLFISNYKGFKRVIAMTCEGKLYTIWKGSWRAEGLKRLKRAKFLEFGLVGSFALFLITPSSIGGKHTHYDGILEGWHFFMVFMMILVTYFSRFGFFGKPMGKAFLFFDSQKNHILEMTKDENLELVVIK